MNARIMVKLDALIGQTVTGYATKGDRVTLMTAHGSEIEFEIVQPLPTYPVEELPIEEIELTDVALPLPEVTEAA